MAVAGSLTWGQATATVRVGATISVPVSSDSSKNDVPGFSSVGVAEIVSASSTEVVIRGLANGTLNVPAGTTWAETDPALDMNTTNDFTLTVLPDEPKVALESQWEDLANRVKAKSDVTITMTSTDPGEGVALEANHFIGVYQ